MARTMKISAMKSAAVILAWGAVAIAASCSHREVQFDIPSRGYRNVSTGMERFLEDQAERFRGRHVAVVTNHSAVDRKFRHITSLLREKGLILDFVLAPEHGLFGYKNSYDNHRFDADENNNLLVYHLHHFEKDTLRFLLQVPDAVIFDIQDLGMRCYTYVSSLKLVMDALEGTGKELIVLDRPNPISFLGVEGPWLDNRFYSKHVASFPSTLFYDMTPGEAARYYRGEYARNVNLRVIPLSGWGRDLYFNETSLPWVPPSPNLPTYKSSVLYTTLVLMEGITISLGRGTSTPFEVIGAPGIDARKFCDGLNGLGLENFRFRPVYFKPTFSAFENQLCGGAHIYYTGGKFSPLEVSYRMMRHLVKGYSEFRWREGKTGFHVDHLAGTDGVRKSIDAGKSWEEYRDTMRSDIEKFRRARKKYLLY